MFFFTERKCKEVLENDGRNSPENPGIEALIEALQNYLEPLFDEIAALSAEVRELGNGLSALRVSASD